MPGTKKFIIHTKSVDCYNICPAEITRLSGKIDIQGQLFCEIESLHLCGFFFFKIK